MTQVRIPSGRLARKVEQVHLEELAMAAVLTIRDVGAVSRTEVVQGVARIFGWTRTGAIVDRRINDAIDRLIVDGEVATSGDSTAHLDRPELTWIGSPISSRLSESRS